MTDKIKKIREEVERLQKRAEYNFNISLAEIERQFWLGESNVLTLIGTYIDSMQEEPVSIWHDANERPQKSGVKTAWITNEKVFYSGWYNKSAFGHEDMRDSIVKFEFDKIHKWCYLDDLLNTD